MITLANDVADCHFDRHLPREKTAKARLLSPLAGNESNLSDLCAE